MRRSYLQAVLPVFISVVVLLLVSVPAVAQDSTPYMVKFIHAGADTTGSWPQELCQVGALTFFSATDPVHGRELWVTDGTESGTRLVKDMHPGITDSYPQTLTAVNGTLFFLANARGTELWRSDGTAEGTVMLKNMVTSPKYLTNVNGTLFFQGNDGVSGEELWKSDGTVAGTVMVKDISPSGGSVPGNLVNVNGTLFFGAYDGVNGTELWKSDGTAAGTVMVKDIYPGSGGSNPSNLTNVNGTLFFQAASSTPCCSYQELWKSDGTAAGTVLVKQIYPYGSPLQNLTNVNGTLFFVARDTVNGTELWKSDGTAAGTVLVKDIYPGSGASDPHSLISMNGTLFFLANSDTSNPCCSHRELWKSDGTAAGTVMVKDTNPGSDGGPGGLTIVNGTLFFVAGDNVNGWALWKTDGTTAGTVMIKHLGKSPSYMTSANGMLLFAYDDGVHGVELWKSDGTAAGTVMVKDIAGYFQPNISNPVDVNGTLFFEATDGTNGAELWKSNGTAEGTVMVKDICPGRCDSSPQSLINVNGTLFFTATEGVNGTELWKSDGTAAGTVIVKDVYPGSASNPSYLTKMNGTLFFTANDGAHGIELWKSDGTAAGTVMVKDIYPGGYDSAPSSLIVVNGTLFFTANNGVNGVELWKSDGTAAGTVMVKDVYPGSFGSSPVYLTGMNGTLYFGAIDLMSGPDPQLWKSDGTGAGTVVVGNIPHHYSWDYPANLTNVDGMLFFTAFSELWRSDGTAAGTVMVKDIFPGERYKVPDRLTNVDGTLFFRATDGVNGYELWKSDGTAAGTVMVKDIYPGATDSNPSVLTNANGTLLFQANDGMNGIELWKSDGTSEGTVMVADIAPGSNSSSPAWLTVSGQRVFFTADDGSGAQLWALDINNPLIASMSAPTPGSTLPGSSVTFNWSSGAGASVYWLWIGTTPGGMELYNQGQGVNTYAVITGLSTNGSTIYVRLFTGSNGGWQWKDYTYKAATSSKAVMTSPLPGSALTGSSATFTWAPGTAATQYWMWIGTTPGGMELYQLGQGLNTSVTINGLPTNGSTLYVRLFTFVDGQWQWNDYTYTAFAVTKAAMITPANGATLSDSSATFQWSATTGATQYWIWIGTTPGGMELYNRGQALNTTATVSSLPVDGSTLYVRLFSMIGGVWQWNDYTYTAATSTKAVMVTPANGATLSGSSITFQWSAATGATQYWMWIGTIPGGMELYNQGQGLNRSVMVTGLPTNGTNVYVRLFSFLGGAWQWNDYTYKAATQ